MVIEYSRGNERTEAVRYRLKSDPNIWFSISNASTLAMSLNCWEIAPEPVPDPPKAVLVEDELERMSREYPDDAEEVIEP